MNFKKTRFAAAFAGIILSGSLLVSSAESAFPDLEIISIDEIPSPQTNPQTEAQTKPQTEAQTKPQTKPQTEAKVKPQTEAQTKPQTEAQTKPQTEAQTKPQTEAQTKPQTKPQTEAKVKPQTEAQTKPQTEAQTKPQTETQTKPQTEAQTKPQTEIKTTPGTVFVVDGRPESEKSETEAESETETESESETESETEAEKIPAQMTPGVYEIASAQDPDLVLDVCYCTVQRTDSHMLQLYHSLDVNQQKFYLEALPHDRYRLSVLHTGEAMTASGDDAAVSMATMNRSDENPAVSMAAMNRSGESPAVSMAAMNRSGEDPAAAQSWTLEKADGDACYIRSESGKYLTLDDADAWAGVPVVLSEFSGEYNQMWEFLPSWISADDTADTDPANPYVKSGRCSGLALTLQFGTETEALTAAALAEHMVASDGHELVIEPGFLDEYVAELAEKYNTPGRPVLFRTTTGDEITLYEIDHGWTLDTAKTKALIEEHLGSGQAETLMPVWEPNENEEEYGKISVGDSYVEVDLKHQKVYLYKDGQMLLETDCVSGTYHTEAETPEGVYYIYFMQSPDVLNGPGYSDFVNFWAAFYRGYGLHDATWRDEFGGDIYLTDGSHGCVNLPLETAGQIYNTLEMGYPVVLYK